MYRSQTIEVWMVKPLSAVGKHCGYMLNTEFTQVLQLLLLLLLNLCGLYFLPSAFFLSTWGVNSIKLYAEKVHRIHTKNISTKWGCDEPLRECIPYACSMWYKWTVESICSTKEIVYLIVGKHWVSVRWCPEESSTGHVQSYTMYTCRIVAIWIPGREYWPYSADPGNQYPTF